ncbi:Cell surface protein [Oopsacas minuta]|uniref:Cell surface protein n=1 Tax=Oopsacas minuta TaxID=111878 RepID=A0AAV7JXP7_9METZ|nr:Cell surface protein [Oopsacas minuta]
MAENTTTEKCDAFQQVIDSIDHLFNGLIHILNNRRSRLIAIINRTRCEYKRKENARQKSLTEIEDLEQALSGVRVRENFTSDVQDETLKSFKLKMVRLSTPEPVPFFHFISPDLEALEKELFNFGQLIKSDVPEYSLRTNPRFAVGKRGSSPGQFDGARGLAIDEVNNQILVADRNNGRIQIFDDKGQFVAKFGKCILSSPFGVCVTENNMFVTDIEHHSIFKFDKETLRLIDKVGKKGSGERDFCSPQGLAADSFSQLYIADSENNRVCIYSSELSFLKQFGNTKLRYPHDVKLTPTLIFVLDWGSYCVHIFTDDGDSLIKSIIKKEFDFDMQIKNAFFFCLDRAENILISDGNHVVRVYNQWGNILYRLGGKGEKEGKFKKPNGIAVSHTGLLYVVSDNPNHVLQCF